MKKKIKASTNIAISSKHCPMVYYPIDEDDSESINFFKNSDCEVRIIIINKRAHLFALVPADTQEQADRLNQEFGYPQL